MIIIGALLFFTVVSSALVLFACMLSSQRNLEFENSDGLTMEIGNRWSSTNVRGMYMAKVPPFSFEPEDLENVQVVRQI